MRLQKPFRFSVDTKLNVDNNPVVKGLGDKLFKGLVKCLGFDSKGKTRNVEFYSLDYRRLCLSKGLRYLDGFEINDDLFERIGFCFREVFRYVDPEHDKVPSKPAVKELVKSAVSKAFSSKPDVNKQVVNDVVDIWDRMDRVTAVQGPSGWVNVGNLLKF